MAKRPTRAKEESVNGSACGCGVPTGLSGSDKHSAVGVDTDLKELNTNHLRRIEGQVRGILRMVEEDRYCADIITQVAAVRESLHSVARNLMRNHLKHCAAAAMQEEGSRRDEMVDELLDLVGKISR
ncbi:MAG: metal-sensitive transcriptional regulator [Phycisphaerales bacterium]|nr:metal-sensitive transcriptional regulator [Phycisphaerales bacterium]